MSDSQRLLELIEDGIVAHGGDLGGWTLRNDDTLQLFDGRIALRAELVDPGAAGKANAVHAHVFAELADYDNEVLDACIFGWGTDLEASLAEAAMIWITGVAGPIKSFLDNSPVCMTTQVGVQGGDASAGYLEDDYGLPGLRAYVGPSFCRSFGNQEMPEDLGHHKPWFRYAAESSAPRRVHLAKTTVFSKGAAGWTRELEIDGHEVSHTDPDWPSDILGPEFGYVIRFAVFEFPANSNYIQRRAELDRTIRHFALNFSQHQSTDQLCEEMVNRGFDPDLVHEVETISPIAFTRVYLANSKMEFPTTIIRALPDGSVQADVPLMSVPAYSRARALALELRQTMKEEEFQALSLYSAEANGILQVTESQGNNVDLSTVKMYPSVIPSRGTTQEMMKAAFAILHQRIEQDRAALPKKKPWWKFW